MTKVCSKCGEEKDISKFHKKKNSIDGHHYDCKECRRIERKKYCKNNRKKIRNYNKEYRKTHKEYRNQYEKNKKNTNINYKLKVNYRIRINKALKNNQKSGHTLELLGCSVEQLKEHLEIQFQEGMTWDNHTIDGWHIDHIIPCSSFDLSDPEEQKKCFHYSNLQPLWAEDNLKKGDKIDKGM